MVPPLSKNSDASADNVVIQDDSARRVIYILFLSITLLVLPIWWWTTAVSRGTLSFPQWDENSSQLPRFFTAKIELMNSTKQQKEWLDLDNTLINLHPSPTKNDFVDIVEARIIHNHFIMEKEDFFLKTDSENVDFHICLVYNEDDQTLLTFKDKKIFVSIALDLADNPQTVLESLMGKIIGHLLPQRRHPVIPDSSSYQVTVTLLIDQDDLATHKVSWNIKDAASKYLLPTISLIHKVSDLQVHYQVKNIFDWQPHLKTEEDASSSFIVESEYLSSFVDVNNWNFAMSTSPSTPINFIIFAPRLDRQPMEFEDGKLYFGIKDWGGVFLLNSPNTDTDLNLQQAMDHFASQLRKFFGIHNCVDESDSIEDLGGASHFEESSLIFRIIKSRYASAISTFQALQRLLTANTEIVVLPIIGKLLQQTDNLLNNVRILLADGQITKALIAVTEARRDIEEAFYHPTMMAQQYFPQEHKLGVYLPLFFPFILPILIATLTGITTLVKSKLKRS